MNIQIPDSIKIGGYVYEIVSDKETDEVLDAGGLVGQACHDDCIIKIKKEMNDQLRVNTFLHETLHCIDQVFNGNKLDEDTINVIANGLHQVIKQLQEDDF
jgi:hypothetical protein